MMLPYIGIGYVTYSMPIVFCWFVCNLRGCYKKTDFALSFVFVLFAAISLLLSFILLPQYVFFKDGHLNIWRNNFVNFGLIVIFVVYYIYFKYNPTVSLLSILKIFKYYLLLNLALVIIFIYDYVLFFNLRDAWSAGSNIIIREQFSTITRYTGIISDPNNLAVGIVAILGFITFSGHLTLRKMFFYFPLVLLIVTASMSKTGFLAFFVLVIACLIFRQDKAYFVFLLLLSTLSVLYVLSREDVMVFNYALERMVGLSNETRVNKFAYYLDSANIIDHFAWGEGGTVFINGIWDKPHIGHFHMIYNYGFIAYILFLYTFFRFRIKERLVEYVPIFILLLGFSTNTGFIDYRFTALSALLISLYARSSSADGRATYNLHARHAHSGARNLQGGSRQSIHLANENGGQ